MRVSYAAAVSDSDPELHDQRTILTLLLKNSEIILADSERWLARVEATMRTDPVEVIPSLSGGLGNQMFQIAMAHVFAQQAGGVVALDDSHWVSLGQGQGPASYLGGLFSKFRRTRLREGAFEVHERQWKPGCRPEIRLPRGVQQVCLRGFWQLPALWERDHDEIRGLFQFEAQRSTRAGLHIRGGDYKFSHSQNRNPYHRQPGMRYYEQAIANLSSLPDFYTDDPAFVRRLAPSVSPVPGSEEDHFRGMAGCAELVLSKSTFAWWAAFLGVVPFVIMPAAWFWDGEYQPSWTMRIDGWEVFSPNSSVWDFYRWHRSDADGSRTSTDVPVLPPGEWSPWEYRTEILNDLVCLTGAGNYFEIGCGTGANFRAIECDQKLAVDASDNANSCDSPILRIEPEDFFASNREAAGLIFVSFKGSAERFGQIMRLALLTVSENGVLACDGLKDPCRWLEWTNLRASSNGKVFLGVDCENGIGLVFQEGNRRGDSKKGGARILNFSETNPDWLSPDEARQAVFEVIGGEARETGGQRPVELRETPSSGGDLGRQS